MAQSVFQAEVRVLTFAYGRRQDKEWPQQEQTKALVSDEEPSMHWYSQLSLESSSLPYTHCLEHE
jgi:hypothetical protein